MDSLTIGLEPGSTAPASGSPHNLALLGAHHLAAVAVAISSDAVRLAGADGIGVEHKKSNRRNCATYSAGDQAQAVIYCDSKHLSMLPARPTLAGHPLSRIHPSGGEFTHFVTRWSVRVLPDVAALRAFAKQLGATHA